MNRALHAFINAEHRIDRSRDKERRRAQLDHFAAVAKSTADGVLGGYSPDIQPDLAEAVIREFSRRLKASSNGQALASVLGAICSDLNRDIKGGRKAAWSAADRVFRKGGD